MASKTRFIIPSVTYHWQRNNLNKPHTTCYNTSMATVIDFIMTKDKIPMERIGMKEKDMQQIAEWIERIVLDIENETTILKVKGEVNEYMKQFPLY